MGEWQRQISKGAIAIEADATAWDSRLVAFIFHLQRALKKNGATLDLSRLPDGLQRLLSLADGEKNGEAEARGGPPAKLSTVEALLDSLNFIGNVVRGIFHLFRRKTAPHGAGFGRILCQSGVESLPTVALISFLTGIILGFIGAVQLAVFGAAIYVADLVGIAMAREMAPLMSGIILTGRTGAAFSATLGSMRTGGEIDALLTFGISPMDFLAVPRVLAMGLMAPLLCIFSTFIGIAGGMAVVLPMFHISSARYVHETLSAVHFSDFCFGVVKSSIFSILIAGLACRSGMQCERTAAGVGRATTSAVVSGITAVIVADAICAVLAHCLHI
jgi:phospholipid/cholesterol/gamma-HCH transport system permease protein